MERGLLIRIGQFDYRSFAVRPALKRDSHRKVVLGEAGRDGNRGDEYQKCVQVRCSSVVDVRGVDPVSNKSGLVLDRFVHNSVELMVSHHFQNMDRQLFPRR